jgi:hypothetical protein
MLSVLCSIALLDGTFSKVNAIDINKQMDRNLLTIPLKAATAKRMSQISMRNVTVKRRIGYGQEESDTKRSHFMDTT